MRIKTACVLVLVFMVWLVPSGLAASSLAQWQYYKEIKVDKQGFSLIKLDTEIMKNCQPEFVDLRISDLQGKEISSQIIQPDNEEVVSEVNLINALEFPGYSSIVLDLGANPQSHNRINLSIKVDEDYLREVILSASADANNWGDLGTGKIFSYDGEQANQISYPTSNLRYLRVNIKNKTGEKPLTVSSAQVMFLPTNIYTGQLINTKILSKKSDKDKTNLIIDLGVPNYIITSVQIETTDRNFNRRVECLTYDKEKFDGQGYQMASDPILDYAWNDYHSVKNSIDINQYARRYLSLVISNGSSPALNITDIKVYGCTPTLIADLSGPSRIWYGNPGAQAPDYDLKEFASLISSRDLQTVQSGVQQNNPDYQAPVTPWTEKNKWLLDAVIVLVAAGFIFFIIRKFKLMKPEEDKKTDI